MACCISRAEQVLEDCRNAVAANRALACRRGNVVELSPANADDLMIVADLHGNRLNFNKLLKIADLANHPRRHLIMQEVCHGGPEYPGDGGCMSHLMLEDIIRLKIEFPERMHFLLSNHELAELGDFPICKSRRMLNLLFRCGIGEMYGDAAEAVRGGYMDFLASCPLAVKLSSSIFISHSLPEKCDRQPFDAGIFEHELSADDWKSGSSLFRFVWGRDFRPENAAAFGQLVGAELLIHGHEPCSAGYSVPNARQVILDSCSAQGRYALLPVGPKLTQAEIVACIHPVHETVA
jgi:hypothetical protein